MGGGEVEERVRRALKELGAATFEDLLLAISWEGDLRPLRRVIARMVREGVLTEEPDYSRRKLVYKLSGDP